MLMSDPSGESENSTMIMPLLGIFALSEDTVANLEAGRLPVPSFSVQPEMHITGNRMAAATGNTADFMKNPFFILFIS